MSHAIEVDQVSKDFRFLSEHPETMKSVLVNLTKGRLNLGKMTKFRALNKVSFNVEKGEFVGIMGRNGAGKSTLLKLITGIYSPTEGRVAVNGSIAPLIELGAGFDGNLSGEENIFLNAAILGFGRKAAMAALPKILEFSELGDFIRRPVRTYSSGMVVRLGFSIAIHLDAPILLLDEVLSVGDAGFQAKCLERITQLHKEGRTIIFITHSPSSVAEFCTRCIVIENHEKVYDGLPQEGCQIYQNLVQR